MAGGPLLQDDQIAADAAIKEAKILFATGGHAHTGGTDGKKIALAGDLSGDNTAATVAKLQGRSMVATAPSSGEVIAWNGSAWAPAAATAASWEGIYTNDKTFVIDDTAWLISQTSTAGYGVSISRNLTPANTDSAVFVVSNLEATDDQAAMEVVTSATAKEALIVTGTKALQVVGGLDVNAGAAGIDLDTTGGSIVMTADVASSWTVDADLTFQTTGTDDLYLISGDEISLAAVGQVHVDDTIAVMDWDPAAQLSATSLKQVTISKGGTGEFDIASGAGTFDALAVDITPNALDDPGSGTLVFSGANFTLASAVGNAEKRALTVGTTYWDYALYTESGLLDLTYTSPAVSGSTSVTYAHQALNFNSGGLAPDTPDLAVLAGLSIAFTPHANDGSSTGFAYFVGAAINDFTPAGTPDGTIALAIGNTFSSSSNWGQGILCYAAENIFSDTGTSARNEYAVVSSQSSPSAVLTSGQQRSGFKTAVTPKGGVETGAMYNGAWVVLNEGTSTNATTYAFRASAINTYKWDYALSADSGKLDSTQVIPDQSSSSNQHLLLTTDFGAISGGTVNLIEQNVSFSGADLGAATLRGHFIDITLTGGEDVAAVVEGVHVDGIVSTPAAGTYAYRVGTGWDYSIDAQSGQALFVTSIEGGSAGGTPHMDVRTTSSGSGLGASEVLVGYKALLTPNGSDNGTSTIIGAHLDMASSPTGGSIGILVGDIDGSSDWAIGFQGHSPTNVFDYTGASDGTTNTLISGSLNYSNNMAASEVADVFKASVTPGAADNSSSVWRGYHSAITAAANNTAVAFDATGTNWTYSLRSAGGAAALDVNDNTLVGLTVGQAGTANLFEFKDGTVAGGTDRLKLSQLGKLELVADATVGSAAFGITQNDDNEPFIDYLGTSAADQTKNISTVNGDGVVEGPKNYSSTAGWQFEGMIRVAINGTDAWIPYYSADVS